MMTGLNDMLTERQNAVINCLQNGWVLVTDWDSKGADVCNDNYQYHITNRLFWNLVDKGLIEQGNAQEFFNYGLTKVGQEIKTKDYTTLNRRVFAE